MEKATISDLKNRLSAYIRKVKAGTAILVVDRNRPVARLEPLSGTEDENAGDRLARLEQAGLVRRASRPLCVEALRRSAPSSSESVVEALVSERREGR